jgi:hypothetical protein
MPFERVVCNQMWKNIRSNSSFFAADVLWRTINLGRQISDISKKSMQATIYCHYD